METMPEHVEQARAVMGAFRDIIGDDLLAVYLQGSAVSGQLRPQSDIDLLAVVARDLTEAQRDNLLTALLRLSGRHPAEPGGPRSFDVIAFRKGDLAEAGCSARAEFAYGEWLRDAFERGERPNPARDPDHTLVLAQARQRAIPLFGPSALELLPEIAAEQVRQAIGEALPVLLEGLRGDERNVLLTLARMWHTASTGEFVAKDTAAAWAIPQIPEQDATTLDFARRGYLGEVPDDWSSRADVARELAANLEERVTKSL
jgi:predicted nucleotidyltransferase